METIQKVSSLSWIEVQFLSKAVETLGRCRTFLKWTYAMAFYLQKNNETQMFEDNQKCALYYFSHSSFSRTCVLIALNSPFISDLEQAVESLAELMETAIDEDKISERRQLTTDKTVYVARRCQIMLEDTLKGYDEVRSDTITLWREKDTDVDGHLFETGSMDMARAYSSLKCNLSHTLPTSPNSFYLELALSPIPTSHRSNPTSFTRFASFIS